MRQRRLVLGGFASREEGRVIETDAPLSELDGPQMTAEEVPAETPVSDWAPLAAGG